MTDAVVGDPVLGIIVGADLFRAFTGPNLGAAVRFDLGPALLLFQLIQAGAENAQGAHFVLELGALVLTGHDHSRGLVVQPYRRGVLLHILPAGTGGTIDLDLDIAFGDLDLDLIHFGHDRNGGCGSVNASLCFGGRDTLHTMHP